MDFALARACAASQTSLVTIAGSGYSVMTHSDCGRTLRSRLPVSGCFTKWLRFHIWRPA